MFLLAEEFGDTYTNIFKLASSEQKSRIYFHYKDGFKAGSDWTLKELDFVVEALSDFEHQFRGFEKRSFQSITGLTHLHPQELPTRESIDFTKVFEALARLKGMRKNE